MPYRLDLRCPLSEEVARVAGEELDAAIGALRDPGPLGLERSVHAARKNTKRVRALVRIVRPGLGSQYRTINGAVRDASALLSTLRDGHAIVQTFATLVRTRDASGSGALGPITEALNARAEAAHPPDAIERAMHDAADMLGTVRADLSSWRVPNKRRVVLDGAAFTYGRGRTAFRRSLERPSATRTHEWRKRVKDQWYHCQLLRDLAPFALEPQQRWLEHLSDALGDNNDLALVERILIDDPNDFDREAAAAAIDLIHEVRRDLVVRAHGSGARLYVEDPEAYARRLRRSAKVFAHHGRELPVGGLDELHRTGA